MSRLDEFFAKYPPIFGADPAAPEKSLLEQLQERHATLAEEIESLIEAREEARSEWATRSASEAFLKLDEEKRGEESRSFATDEDKFADEFAPKQAELRALEARINEQEAIARSREVAARASAGEPASTTRASVGREPLTYRQDNQKETSYWLDLAAHSIPEVRQKASGRIDGYAERLERHAKEISVEMEKRSSTRERRAIEAIETAEAEVRARYGIRGGLDTNPFESRAPTRVPGQGGYFVPPLWLIDEYIPALRPGRVAADLARQMPLPPGTDSINVPKLATPTLVGVQGSDGAPVPSRDFTDTFVQANVKTIAGQEDVPIQLIEQSPGQILDRVITTDLYADYNKQVDLQVLLGNGTGAPLSGGQIVGLYPATNWSATTLTWNNGTPTGQGWFQAMGAMASKTAYSRFSLTDFAYLMHPRRWFWGATYPDSTGRPLVSADRETAYNPAVMANSPYPYEGLAGNVPWGPRVYIDANAPTNDAGHATTGVNDADIMIGAIWDDIWLFEGDLRTRVLSEVLSGTLEIRFQIYNYVTLLARYGQSIVILTGTALAPPTGDGGNISF